MAKVKQHERTHNLYLINSRPRKCLETLQRLSGDLYGTSGITLVGIKGSAETTEGLIITQRVES